MFLSISTIDKTCSIKTIFTRKEHVGINRFYFGVCYVFFLSKDLEGILKYVRVPNSLLEFP